MKLAPLLAQYLNNHNELQIPGLGIFKKSHLAGPDETDKRNAPGGIYFEQVNVKEADPELLEFISKETSKMRVLAINDLQSQVEDIKHFLNSGKPYYISGIGTLTRRTNGQYDFYSDSQHASISERKKEATASENSYLPQAYIEKDKPAAAGRGNAVWLVVLLTALAIGASAWYYFSKKNNDHLAGNTTVTDTTTNTTAAAPPPMKDTTAKNVTPPPAVTGAAGTYTYVLEVAAQPRADKRYNQLKNIPWPVELLRADSNTYKIVIRLPMDKDTTRMKDSLRILNGRKVYIDR